MSDLRSVAAVVGSTHPVHHISSHLMSWSELLLFALLLIPLHLPAHLHLPFPRCYLSLFLSPSLSLSLSLCLRGTPTLQVQGQCVPLLLLSEQKRSDLLQCTHQGRVGWVASTMCCSVSRYLLTLRVALSNPYPNLFS